MTTSYWKVIRCKKYARIFLQKYPVVVREMVQHKSTRLNDIKDKSQHSQEFINCANINTGVQHSAL